MPESQTPLLKRSPQSPNFRERLTFQKETFVVNKPQIAAGEMKWITNGESMAYGTRGRSSSSRESSHRIAVGPPREDSRAQTLRHPPLRLALLEARVG